MNKKTIVIITHDIHIAEQCQRIIQIKDGLIQETTNVSGINQA